MFFPMSTAASWGVRLSPLVLLIGVACVRGTPPTATRPPLSESQHEVFCGGSGCFNEAMDVCFEQHGTIEYRVLGQRPAGGGLIIECGSRGSEGG